MSKLMHARLAAFLSIAIASIPSVAHASDASSAQALFDEGRALMTAGNYAEACPKLAASQRLDPGAGTLMNLATCYERRGHLASAWAAFREAASSSRASGHSDWERAARDRASKLEPELSRLVVVVPGPSELAGLQIERDGRLVDRAEWGAAIPVDGGQHVLRAMAPGYATWSTEVTVAERGGQSSITIPALTRQAAMTTDAPSAIDERTSNGATRRILGVAVAGAGVVGVGLGATFGLLAKSSQDASREHCNATNNCTARGVELGDQASSRATISTIAFIAGGALLAGGLVLYFTAPSAQQKTSALWISPSLGGAALGGAF